MSEWMTDVKAKILVVDDEPFVVAYITKIVSGQGYDIRNAYDGEEAVSIAKDFRPDCVVTGFAMPRMDGFTEATAILHFLPTCKFVFVTSNAHNPAVREEYARLGRDFRFLLDKPFKRIELLNALAWAGFPCTGGQ
jgi:CheY-like chemotaxis protein